jgi:hypothetical protein
MMTPHQFEVEPSQQNAPDHFDLLLGERQADATVMATSKPD